LIRLPYGDNPFAILAEDKDKNGYAICLYGEGNRAAPACYAPLSARGNHVLSYGCGYSIEIDHLTQFEFGGRTLSERGGTICFIKGRSYLCAAPSIGTGYHSPAYLDLEKATLHFDPSLDGIVIFAKWALQTQPKTNTPSQELLNFSLPNQQGA
jgi:hypothetical protein